MPPPLTPAKSDKPAFGPRRGRGRLDRAAILEQAAQLADREGLDALTLTALAGKLGIRPPSLYNHVASLEELRQVLAVRALAELDAALSRAALGKTGTGAVVALGEAYRAYAHAHPGLYAAITAVNSSATPELHAARTALLNTVGAVLRSFGLVGKKEVLHAMRTFYSLMHGFVSLEAEGSFALPVEPAASFRWLLTHFSVGLRNSRPSVRRSEGRGDGHSA